MGKRVVKSRLSSLAIRLVRLVRLRQTCEAVHSKPHTRTQRLPGRVSAAMSQQRSRSQRPSGDRGRQLACWCRRKSKRSSSDAHELEAGALALRAFHSRRDGGQFLSERKKSGRSSGFFIGRKARIRFGNFVCLTFQARPLRRLAIVTAAENHFLVPNDNHDIANRRIRITPDRNCRRSVFAGHRNVFLCPKAFPRLDDTGR